VTTDVALKDTGRVSLNVCLYGQREIGLPAAAVVALEVDPEVSLVHLREGIVLESNRMTTKCVITTLLASGKPALGTIAAIDVV
jgi:hypothetical protein